MDARDKRQVLGGYPAILCPTWAHRFSQSTLNISRPPIDEETSAQRRTSGERHFWNGLEDIHILRAAARAPHMLNMLLTQVLPYCCRRLASSAATKMNGGIDQWNRPHFHWNSNICQFGRDLLGMLLRWTSLYRAEISSWNIDFQRSFWENAFYVLRP